MQIIQTERDYSLIAVSGIFVLSGVFQAVKVLTAKTLRFGSSPGVVKRRGVKGAAYYYESPVRRIAVASIGTLILISAIWDLSMRPWTVPRLVIDPFAFAFSLGVVIVALKARPIETSPATDLDSCVPSARDRLIALLSPLALVAVGLWILLAKIPHR